MAFAEPRPHRRPFREWNGGFASLVVAPKQLRGELAVTSLTLANQSTKARFIDVRSRNSDEPPSGGAMLMMVWLSGRSTLHLPFPHPLMVGPGRTLVVDTHQKAAKPLIPVTAVGYEWLRTDDKSA